MAAESKQMLGSGLGLFKLRNVTTIFEPDELRESDRSLKLHRIANPKSLIRLPHKISVGLSICTILEAKLL